MLICGRCGEPLRVPVGSWKETSRMAPEEPQGSVQTVKKLASRSLSLGRPSVVRFGQGQEGGKWEPTRKPGMLRRPFCSWRPCRGRCLRAQLQRPGNYEEDPSSCQLRGEGDWTPTHSHFVPALFAPEHPPRERPGPGKFARSLPERELNPNSRLAGT